MENLAPTVESSPAPTSRISHTMPKRQFEDLVCGKLGNEDSVVTMPEFLAAADDVYQDALAAAELGDTDECSFMEGCESVSNEHRLIFPFQT